MSLTILFTCISNRAELCVPWEENLAPHSLRHNFGLKCPGQRIGDMSGLSSIGSSHPLFVTSSRSKTTREHNFLETTFAHLSVFSILFQNKQINKHKETNKRNNSDSTDFKILTSRLNSLPHFSKARGMAHNNSERDELLMRLTGF